MFFSFLQLIFARQWKKNYTWAWCRRVEDPKRTDRNYRIVIVWAWVPPDISENTFGLRWACCLWEGPRPFIGLFKLHRLTTHSWSVSSDGRALNNGAWSPEGSFPSRLMTTIKALSEAVTRLWSIEICLRFLYNEREQNCTPERNGLFLRGD